jgi:ribonuclease D
VGALTGWRRELFGQKALELKKGRLALTVENGKVATLEWREAAAGEAPIDASSDASSDAPTQEVA